MLINTLKGIQEEREGHKKETYKTILNLAKDRVIFYAKGKKKNFCVYTVPVWLVNRPLYDAEKAASYVQKKLTMEGLHVTKITPNQLYIQWIFENNKNNNRQKDLFLNLL